MPANTFIVVDADASTRNYIGPFLTLEEAEAHAASHRTEHPTHSVLVAPLVDPANC